MFRVFFALPIVLGFGHAATAKLHAPSEITQIDTEAIVDVPLYFAAGVVAPNFARDMSWQATPIAE